MRGFVPLSSFEVLMKVMMKLSRRHPQGYMNFGRHVITNKEQMIELNESEIIDLNNAGPKHWFEVSEIKEEPKKTNKKRKENK